MTDVLDVLSDEEAALTIEEGFPEWLDPMLATLVEEPFSDDQWIYERKLDGERCLGTPGNDLCRRRDTDSLFASMS